MTKGKSFLRQVFNTWGLWALMTLAASIFALTMAHFDGQSARRLAQEGADAEAMVTSLTQTSTRSNNRTQHHFQIGFSFKAGDHPHDATQIISEALYRSLRTGDRIVVRYWTRDPSLVEAEPGHHASQALIGQIVAGVALVLTVGLAGLGWRWASKARWMVRNGVERPATVTRLIGSRFNFGKTGYHRAEWRDEAGVIGQSRLNRSKHLPGAGTPITILTDPSGIRPAIWEGDL